MKLTYVFHSCFVLESAAATFIFDYYKDSDNGYIHKHLPFFPGRVYVFASHGHADHYQPEVLQWKAARPDIRYIFSKDIVDEGLYKGDEAIVLGRLETYSDNLISVKTFGSTDLGISFLVQTAGKTIFHAGDLNNWHWEEESSAEEARGAQEFYLSELQHLVEAAPAVDLAMFPVDPRLGKDYARGAKQFLEQVRTRLFAPMHFWEKYGAANAFKADAETRGAVFFNIERQEDSVEIA